MMLESTHARDEVYVCVCERERGRERERERERECARACVCECACVQARVCVLSLCLYVNLFVSLCASLSIVFNLGLTKQRRHHMTDQIFTQSASKRSRPALLYPYMKIERWEAYSSQMLTCRWATPSELPEQRANIAGRGFIELSAGFKDASLRHMSNSEIG